jgi:signal transduction histidine kinase
MSLRSKVFLLFGALLAILLGSQWFMMRSITNDVSRELGQVAFSVARDTATFFILGNFQWNNQQSQIIDLKSLEITGSKDISTNIRVKALSTDDDTLISEQSFIYRPPAVEIRLNNQIKDDFLELITGAGTQSIPIPRDKMIETVNRLENRMLTGTLIILVFGLVIAAYFSHHLSAPLRDLSRAAESVASGELGTTIDRKGKFISGEIKSTVESFNHMSKQLADVEQLKSRIRENEHYRELGEIARGLAHSIRNPLNTLGLTVEELSRDDLANDRRKSLVDSASRQINRVDTWIRSFMTFSLSGDTESHPIELLPLIKDIQLEASQLEERKITFNVDSQGSTIIKGVDAEIRAILHALIINAVEASPLSGTININMSESEDHIDIAIIDQGSGIPREIQDKLFVPHQTTKARGSGMGLFIAHRLITNRYQGVIKIQNNEDSIGTNVQLSLAKNRII